jgi:hypothetical protein
MVFLESWHGILSIPFFGSSCTHTLSCAAFLFAVSGSSHSCCHCLPSCVMPFPVLSSHFFDDRDVFRSHVWRGVNHQTSSLFSSSSTSFLTAATFCFLLSGMASSSSASSSTSSSSSLSARALFFPLPLPLAVPLPLVAALGFLAPAAPDFLAVVVVEAEAAVEGEGESFFNWSLTPRSVVFSPSSEAIVAGGHVSENLIIRTKKREDSSSMARDG